ncbi:taurine ABC transporter substrate-binding protein [Xenorhabdus sp. 12]|uniref:Taurine ABC transporter substrate-binding protein n=1 Tax=Xenorhabdus santafensis TaxID=2582833 RepID=A0ABU4S9Y3_9GAMM|nr:taurine ABC transporter substrate-binding protein [Xenorhabdus sp. 12]MDX7987613.1 taurine ABC transporter substrate-binding protein [Xenorhabdus sp. 12]
MRKIPFLLLVSFLLLFTTPLQAKEIKVTIAWQSIADPAKVAQFNRSFEKEVKANVQWRKFDSGASILRAMASGDVQIGYIGSSPLAIAASRQLPIKAFLINSQIGQSESLVVRPQIRQPEQLKGKRIAVPFISTAHYSLFSALKHWGIAPEEVKIVNMQPPAIVAAWKRGDIDGAYVWSPSLNEITATGHVLTDSNQVSQWGNMTLNVWVVRNDFAKKHPKLVTEFTRAIQNENNRYLSNPRQWLAVHENIAAIASFSGLPVEQVAHWVEANHYFGIQEQQTLLQQKIPEVIKKTTQFLTQQGKSSNTKDDYHEYVTDAFIHQAYPVKQ